MKKLALISFLAPLAVFAQDDTTAKVVETATKAVTSPFAPLGFGLAVFASAIAIGLIGYSAAAAIGRNPSAKSDITSGILLPMVLAEGLGIIAVILAFVK
ncbi:MAG: ATP synthase F0 subunit C [bacterium]